MSAGRYDHTDKRSDEARRGPREMTLEERAAFIACALPSARIGGVNWTNVRDRALQQLREVVGQ